MITQYHQKERKYRKIKVHTIPINTNPFIGVIFFLRMGDNFIGDSIE